MRSFGGSLDRIAKSGDRLSTFLEGEGAKLQRARTMTGILESIKTTRRELDENAAEMGVVKIDRGRLTAPESQLTSNVSQLEANGDLLAVLDIEKDVRTESRPFLPLTLVY